MSTREEMIDFLVNECGMDGAQVAVLEGEALENLFDIEKESVDEAEFEFDEIEEPCSQVATEHYQVPAYTDPNWNDYVLSQFVDEELYDGNPTVDGLRRVVELLVGEVVDMQTDIVQTPHLENGRCASAVVVLTIRPNDGEIHKRFSGSADAYEGNLQTTVQKFPVAMAETRAEGRALRRALRLRNVAAEELGDTKVAVPLVETGESMNKNQVNMINMLAANTERGLNVNVEKLRLLLTGGIGNKWTLEDGQIIIKALSSYQADKSLIPVEALNYDSNWSTQI